MNFDLSALFFYQTFIWSSPCCLVWLNFRRRQVSRRALSLSLVWISWLHVFFINSLLQSWCSTFCFACRVDISRIWIWIHYFDCLWLCLVEFDFQLFFAFQSTVELMIDYYDSCIVLFGILRVFAFCLVAEEQKYESWRSH